MINERERLMMRAAINVLKRRKTNEARSVTVGPGSTVEIPPPNVSFRADAPVVNVDSQPIANALQPLVESFQVNLAALREQNGLLQQMVNALIENNKRPILVQPTFSPQFAPTFNAEFDSHTLIAWAREMVLNREAQATALLPPEREVKEFVIRHSDGTTSKITGG